VTLERVVVVSFRWAASPAKPREAMDLAEQLTEQASALGARVCSFGGYELGFVFDEADVEAAIELAARTVHEARMRPVSKAGVAVGEVAAFGEAAGSTALSWGEPVVVAAALARSAQPGEVLLDATVPGVIDGTLTVVPSGRDLTFGGVPRLSYSLDIAHAVSQGEDALYATNPPEPAPRVPTGSFEIIELAREALRRGDTISLDAALQHLKVTGEHPEVVERLAGVLAMTRGAKEEGLRVLRRAAAQETREDRRARAVLAYSVGLAAAGRTEEALLESLSALALTRAHGDTSGEVACTTFLSQLSEAAGHGGSAARWQSVADRIADQR